MEYDLVVTWVNVSDPVWQKLAQASGCRVKDYLSGGGDVDVFQVVICCIFVIIFEAQFLLAPTT